MEATAPLMDVVQVSLANRKTHLEGALALKLIQAVTAAPAVAASSPGVPSVPAKVPPRGESTVHVIA